MGEPEPAGGAWVAGVDGCRAGWIAIYRRLDGASPVIQVVSAFAEIVDGPCHPPVIAVDIPIGLPERVGHGGRAPERAVRRLLGERQSSVFSVPSRSAVMASDYGEACEAAHRTSEPPRRVSKQCYHLFPKIREVDALMTPKLEARVYEVHPELAFWRLNGERAMALPKKVRSVPYPPGLDERRALLARYGYDAAFLTDAPRGAGPDDLIDAAANALIAERIARGEAESFPPEPEHDGKGLRMAIWA